MAEGVVTVRGSVRVASDTKMCRRCEVARPASEFYASRTTRDRLQSWCKPCYVEVRRARYLANRDRELAQNRAWELTHPDQRRAIAKRSYHNNKAASRERHRKWVANNPERNRELWKRWYRNNTDKAKAYAKVGYARRRGAAGHATVQQIADRIAMFGGNCWLCGNPADTIDHVIPIAKGGSLWPANVRPACAHCNYSKQDRIVHRGH